MALKGSLCLFLIQNAGLGPNGGIVARGEIVGNAVPARGHLECKGLILGGGTIHAIPELQGTRPGVELSHEAAVGKIAQEEIEYLNRSAPTGTVVSPAEGLSSLLSKNHLTTVTYSEDSMTLTLYDPDPLMILILWKAES